MEQFIFKEENFSRDSAGARSVVIDGDENFHLSRVLRVRQGEKILATDGSGKTLMCVVTSVGKDNSVCEVIEEYDDLNSPPRAFCIAMALLKPVSKLETALEKCTELGARRFLLFNCERSENARPRLDRMQGIVKAAVKQSLRSRIPEVVLVRNLEEAAADGRSFEMKLVLHEKSENMVSARISQMNREKSVIALIGPEGGFSDDEITFLIANGYESFSLGKGRLRSETAAIAIATLLSEY
ncbi:MAG: 16S rRNA (uracil(1498)-N(3))-methyltransferase [Bacteroidetes bacterium]|nr:16S rRNA (uracil(1498)-N(3))-methyltransferase [Bacteroidota bacterium]